MQFGRFPFESKNIKGNQVLGQSFLNFCVCKKKKKKKIPCYTIFCSLSTFASREDRVLGKGKKKGLSIRYFQSTCPFQTLCIYYVSYSVCIPMKYYTKKHVLFVYKKLILFSFFFLFLFSSFFRFTNINSICAFRQHSFIRSFTLLES